MGQGRVYLHLVRCDNQLTINVNDRFCYTSGMVHEDPIIDVSTEITTSFSEGDNIMEAIGYNSHYAHAPSAVNPWHFQFYIEQDGVILYRADQSGTGAPDAVVWTDHQTIRLSHIFNGA